MRVSSTWLRLCPGFKFYQSLPASRALPSFLCTASDQKTGGVEGLGTRLVICRLQRLDDVVRTYTFCIIQKVKAATTSSNLCSPHITGKCSVPFRWNEQLRHFSHDKMYQGPHYLLAVSIRTFNSPDLICSGGGVGELVSVGTGGREGGTAATYRYSVCRSITVSGDSRIKS